MGVAGTMLSQALALLPSGPAWRAEPGTELRALLTALCVEFERVQSRVEALLTEADPRQTTELLADWEAFAGLPGACDQAGTAEERRKALVARLAGVHEQSEAYYVQLAADLGYVITIERYSPFLASSVCTKALTQSEWRAVFRVVTSHGANDALLECIFRSRTQAHTWVEFEYQ